MEGHTCNAAAGKAAPHAARCGVPGCREQLSAHNRVHCERCRQVFCIRHRFEGDHPCVAVDVLAKAAMQRARQEMSRAELDEAHKTLTKVFGNILAEPGNAKFRTLKKANAVVQEKLRHPACREVLLLCGFEDTSEAYVCRSNADLSVMRQMASLLKAFRPEAPFPAATPDQGASTGTRIVNGVITRDPPPARTVDEAAISRTSAASLVPYPVAVASPPLPSASSAPTTSAAGVKPKSAFDFERRASREQRLQVQEAQLLEARRQQKERYKTNGTYSGPAPPSEPLAQQPKHGGAMPPQDQGCSLQ